MNSQHIGLSNEEFASQVSALVLEHLDQIAGGESDSARARGFIGGVIQGAIEVARMPFWTVGEGPTNLSDLQIP